jgi:hypothetical protein
MMGVMMALPIDVEHVSYQTTFIHSTNPSNCGFPWPNSCMEANLPEIDLSMLRPEYQKILKTAPPNSLRQGLQRYNFMI